jgi:hypothetical protein
MSNFLKQKIYSREAKTATKDVKPKIMIVCEGEKTEPYYFEAFRVSSLDVRIDGAGFNTLSLVQKAINLKKKAIEDKEPFDHVWVVMDRDSFPACNFNNCLQLASENEIEVAYSNEAFEIWYILHFKYQTTGMQRGSYYKILSKLLGERYKKDDKNMYERIRDKQQDAIRNAKRLLNEYGPTHNPEKDNPCTTVFKLVELLNQYLD